MGYADEIIQMVILAEKEGESDKMANEKMYWIGKD